MKIVLIGFMGAGKSSVAKALADRLNLKYIELDDLVLRESGRKSIAEIFEKDGEVVFRQMEINKAKNIAGEENAVVAAGGGVVENKIILDYLKENGIVIYLDASFDEIGGRLHADGTRPLFQNKEKARKLYDFRKNLYEEYADEIVEIDGKRVGEIAEEIVKRIKGQV